MKRLIFFTLLTCCAAFIKCTDSKQKITIGNPSFVHLEQIDNVWWFVDGNDNKFISTGMNHMQANIRFAAYNKEHWAKEFGRDVLANGRFNSNAIP